MVDTATATIAVTVPVGGPASGGTAVTITGTNLAAATSVTFGTGNPAGAVTRSTHTAYFAF